MCVHGDKKAFPLVEVLLEIDGKLQFRKVRVIPSLPDLVLLGRDLHRYDEHLTKIASPDTEVEWLQDATCYAMAIGAPKLKEVKKRKEKRIERLQYCQTNPPIHTCLLSPAEATQTPPHSFHVAQSEDTSLQRAWEQATADEPEKAFHVPGSSQTTVDYLSCYLTLEWLKCPFVVEEQCSTELGVHDTSNMITIPNATPLNNYRLALLPNNLGVMGKIKEGHRQEQGRSRKTLEEEPLGHRRNRDFRRTKGRIKEKEQRSTDRPAEEQSSSPTEGTEDWPEGNERFDMERTWENSKPRGQGDMEATPTTVLEQRGLRQVQTGEGRFWRKWLTRVHQRVQGDAMAGNTQARTINTLGDGHFPLNDGVGWTLY
ncbi:hypothetical protein NDU88_003832 [Pleurodeles waltl]|uniref:Uncharacterized protein n=1 Tax=Pleurodeles waltl TaxID=8319 RepID=A0AAV7SH38_PLEWA|nr:hypothetical protein NDU88_003832 [Pleurodeles waltl]